MPNFGFWSKLKKPIMILAPMADVTDQSFRIVIAKYGKPDVMYTEFVSADGLFLGGRESLIKDLTFTENERPIVAQFFTSKPEYMEKAARLAKDLGFDGVDINMGCPDRSVVKQGAGASLIKNPKLAREIIKAAKRGAESLPVSVKTRIGFSKNELHKWLPEILAEEPAALIIHARTMKEMSKVPVRWEHIKEAVDIRNKSGYQTLVIGNGDVSDLCDAEKKVEESGADGAMLGRAIFGNPWLFDSSKKNISIEEKLNTLVEHTFLFEKLLTGHKSFAVMKKHYKAYVNGWDGAKELRMRLMETENASEVKNVVSGYLSSQQMDDKTVS